MQENYLRVFFIFRLLVFMFSSLYAAPQGQIEGYVSESQYGEPLLGANVFIEGTSLGSATDLAYLGLQDE